ncbi:MAG: hypothetical protein JXB23_12725, partial [Candidatus Aminicenantes bacterium]|nr:hypothetical protein [Candidatus Aminicenantes bacterium]
LGQTASSQQDKLHVSRSVDLRQGTGIHSDTDHCLGRVAGVEYGKSTPAKKREKRMDIDNTTLKAVVKFHAGYKGETEPRRVIVDDHEMTVDKIFERKRILDSETGKVCEEFRCLLDGREAKVLICPSGEHYITFRT